VEALVDRFDVLADTAEVAELRPLVSAVGTDAVAPKPATTCSSSWPATALSPTMISQPQSGPAVPAPASIAAAASPSGSSGGAR
jgi:hypothetical protein